MNEEHQKLGFYYSIALHLSVVVAVVVSVFLKSLFPEKHQENTLVFEMVDMPQNTPQQQEAPSQQQESPDITTPDVKEIKPLTLPEPAPEPEPTPQPTPTPKPTDKPKPEPKPVEKPKKMSYADFIKNNPKAAKTPTAPQTSKQKSITAPKIKAQTGNLEQIGHIGARGVSSAAMKNALNDYVQEIYRAARRNWTTPAGVMPLSAKIEFRVSKTGIISGLRIVESSGDPDFDRSVLAVFASISLPPPPDNEAHPVSITFKAD